ncbi:MAG: TIGR04372 family glycosyltransferase [Magnetococcales bacterium]|nr:TIGR04372 family glycosyltransferase [Magnetococcales bacterium]
MSKPQAFYPFFQVGRIGEIAMRIPKARNLHPESAWDLTILLPSAQIPTANQAVIDILCRGVRVMHVASEQEAHAIYQQAKAEDPRAIWIDPDPAANYIEHLNRFHDQPRTYFASLSREDVERGWRLREKLGMPRNARIVTCHVREAGYLDHKSDMSYHGYRNADIQNFFYALIYLIKRGYWVVRLGDTSMRPLSDFPDHLIDAPFHPDYEPFFDPYFIASSDFYLGMLSGPNTLAGAFGVPQLLTNVPLSCASEENEGDMMIPKKYYSHQLGRMLTYEEIMMSPILDFNRLYLYQESEIEVIENGSTEIFAAVWEMESRLNNRYPFREEAELSHARVKQIQQKAHLWRQHTLTPDHYPHYPFVTSYLLKGRMSHEFIRMHPGYLGHDFPRIAWGFHPRVEGLPARLEAFHRERMQASL